MRYTIQARELAAIRRAERRSLILGIAIALSFVGVSAASYATGTDHSLHMAAGK